MKVVAFNGSPRKEGNTSRLIGHVLKVLEKEGIETETIQLGGNLIHGCTACMKCFEKKDNHCVIKSDIVNDCIEKMIEADGIIIASPTYFADLSPETKALIDRAGFVGKANGELFKRKVGAAVVAVRRAGGIHAFDSINHFFTISEMIIPGSSYWNVGVGLVPGDVDYDGEGVQTMETLGQNMAWLMEKIGGISKTPTEIRHERIADEELIEEEEPHRAEIERAGEAIRHEKITDNHFIEKAESETGTDIDREIARDVAVEEREERKAETQK